jgi:hypothetical protein
MAAPRIIDSGRVEPGWRAGLLRGAAAPLRRLSVARRIITIGGAIVRCGAILWVCRGISDFNRQRSRIMAIRQRTVGASRQPTTPVRN